MKHWKLSRKNTAAILRYRLTLRQKMYLIAFIITLVCMNPLVAYADVLGNRIMDVYAEITVNVKETNDILKSAFDYAKMSPYKIVNRLAEGGGKPQQLILRRLNIASQTAGLAVATLLLLIDFFRKTVNFEWSSKWENVLLFLIKILVMKQVVQNTDVIMDSLYALFNYVNTEVINAANDQIDFLPYGDTVTYIWHDFNGTITAALTKGWWQFWEDVTSGNMDYSYEISKDAVKMFYPNAVFPDTLNSGTYDIQDTAFTDFANPTTTPNFMPTLKMILMQPYFWILKACAYLVYVITIGRVFELCLYTLFAPLPLATFASDTTHDIAKNFLKNYVAVVLQVSVIIGMFAVYVAIMLSLDTEIRAQSGMAFLRFVALLALASGVLKSSAWSRKICGIG